MARIISIANQKGGIGKTTTAVALSTCLQEKGKKVLLIDTDMQCNSTDIYGAKTNDATTLYDVLIGNDGKFAPLSDAVQSTPSGDIVASDRLLVGADPELQRDLNGLYRLQDAIENMKHDYDYIVIDTNPTVNQLLYNCLIASDYVVIPVTADRLGLIGLSQISDTIKAVKSRANKKLKILGLLVVKYKANLNLEKEVLDNLAEAATMIGTKLFKTKIRESVKVRESQGNRIPLTKFAPKCTSTIDYMDFADEIIKEG